MQFSNLKIIKILRVMNTGDYFDVGIVTIVSSNQHCVKYPQLGKISATRASAASRQNLLLAPRAPRASANPDGDAERSVLRVRRVQLILGHTALAQRQGPA
jgi:hypothetical protein